jgi:hypothetical protein
MNGWGIADRSLPEAEASGYRPSRRPPARTACRFRGTAPPFIRATWNDHSAHPLGPVVANAVTWTNRGSCGRYGVIWGLKYPLGMPGRPIQMRSALERGPGFAGPLLSIDRIGVVHDWIADVRGHCWRITVLCSQAVAVCAGQAANRHAAVFA